MCNIIICLSGWKHSPEESVIILPDWTIYIHAGFSTVQEVQGKTNSTRGFYYTCVISCNIVEAIQPYNSFSNRSINTLVVKKTE